MNRRGPTYTRRAMAKDEGAAGTGHERDAGSDRPVTPKGQRTRELLVTAASGVFAEKQYLETNISDIVAAAGVSHGTFYHYFSSKEEVFREVALRLQAQMLEARTHEEVPAEASVLERIEATNRAYLRAYREQARLIAAIEQVASFNEEFRAIRREIRTGFVDRSEAAIHRLQQQGEIAGDVSPRYAANALGSMVERFAFVWLVLGEDFDFDESVRSLTLLWARSLGLDVPEGALGKPPRRRRRRGN